MVAGRYEHFLSVQRALDALQRCVTECPPPIAGSLAARVESARVAVAALDPTRELVAVVRRWLGLGWPY
jgi:hypothetical protein